MGTGLLPDLTSCCGVVSVKTGTYFIAVTNQAAAVIEFVSYLSTIIILANDIYHDDYPASKIDKFNVVTIAAGILVTGANIAMGVVLMRGLIKEKTCYLRWYLVIGPGVIALNMVVIGCSVFLVDWITSIITLLGIVMEIYFLLVIRSAYREMLMEEKDYARARNNLSSGDNLMGEI